MCHGERERESDECASSRRKQLNSSLTARQQSGKRE